jgi:hypothetical protein
VESERRPELSSNKQSVAEEAMDQSFVPDLSDSVIAMNMNGGTLIQIYNKNNQCWKKKKCFPFPGLVYWFGLLQITAVLDLCLVLYL